MGADPSRLEPAGEPATADCGMTTMRQDLTCIWTVSAAIAAALAAIFTFGCGAQPEPARQSEATSSARDVTPTPPTPMPRQAVAVDPENIEKARKILTEVGRVYREAPTLTDSLALTIREQTQVMRVRFDKEDRAIEMSLPTESALVIDGTLYRTSSLLYDVYLEKEIEGDPAKAIADLFGWVPPYHFAMRASEDVSTYLNGLGLGILRDPRLRGYSKVADEKGRELHRVTLDAVGGVGHVHIDSETMLITHLTMDVLPGPGEPASAPSTRVRVDAQPNIADELAEPLAFDPGDREPVHDPAYMVIRPLRAGDRAPNFTLTTLDGDVVNLRDLRGNVVVLDFWATWCVPCIQGLPHLDRFARWAIEENQPVKVFAVNALEQHTTKEARREAAKRFWRERDFIMPTLLDEENLVISRYGYFGTLPVAFVIDPNGRISRVHMGFSRNIYQILKADTERALRQAAEAG